MPQQLPSFELQDRQGSLALYSGAVGTSWTAVPTVADKYLQNALIICPDTNDYSKYLEVSFDGGTTVAARLFSFGSMNHKIKGNITQIHIRGSVATVDYKITLEKEVDA